MMQMFRKVKWTINFNIEERQEDGMVDRNLIIIY